ncbi:class II fumarate hydratase [Catenovulum sediminis]|uniref:Fumarate hydratase class II n=1 Tax=Catenovulum sediminis TaxID=1740262 RepID=A0ABV1RGI8_9ALTE|nr:class II fumarate hydratase [Catenovulum sediminis]
MQKHNNAKFRVESDSMGEVNIPVDALYGAQTQRAVQNFTISHLRLPQEFIQALALIKAAAANANDSLGLLVNDKAQAIERAALAIHSGQYAEQFPLDVFQTGSGTSSNMNVNEVIAHLAYKLYQQKVHANDDVNKGQSSNDVIPSSIHLSVLIELKKQLLPAIQHLVNTLDEKAELLKEEVKTGRTHLMDALPITFAQEVGGWSQQLKMCAARIEATQTSLSQLAIGGTAVGTGLNSSKLFAQKVCDYVNERLQSSCEQATSNWCFVPARNYFTALSCQDSALELSGQLKVLATSLLKISNDLRWMNSGPLSGLSEINLESLQPGSSIMPGKVNPVIPEAVAMACAQVTGNDGCITVAAQSGNFQLNVMLPVIAYNLLQSISLMRNACYALADKSIATFTINREKIEQTLSYNPILVTALNQKIGYEQGAKIAKRAYAEKRPVIDVAVEMTDLDKETLADLLDPKKLT